MWHGMNRRRFPRANYQCLITLGKKGAQRYILTNTENIGLGGICVILDEDAGIFAEVEIELALKDNYPPIKCKGHIAWVVKSQAIKSGEVVPKFDTGIEFVNLKEVDRQRVEKVMEDRIQIENKNKGVK
jgi:hypothetical protein